MIKRRIFSLIIILIITSSFASLSSCFYDNTPKTIKKYYYGSLVFYWDICMLDNCGDIQSLYTYEDTPYRIDIRVINDVIMSGFNRGYVFNKEGFTIELESGINYYIRPVSVEETDGKLLFNKSDVYTMFNLNDNQITALETQVMVPNCFDVDIETNFIGIRNIDSTIN